MGNREDLLAGAWQCLLEKGYGRTTARDITAASGVSLAAIGYHFGTKEALLNEALTGAAGTELGDEFESAITAAGQQDDALAQFETVWQHVLSSFPRHRRLLAATLENLGQLEHVSEVREYLEEGQGLAIAGIAHLVQTHIAGTDEDTADAIGTFYYALVNGLITLWLVDPNTAPSSETLTKAIRALTGQSA